jgi:hypothetical protein
LASATIAFAQLRQLLMDGRDFDDFVASASEKQSAS